MLNITPDSFSDGGNFLSFDQAIAHAGVMIGEGADVIEIGGESTRPGAKPVSAADEIARVITIITEIHRRWPGTRLAIDTAKHEIAEASIAAGVSIVNDVSALRLDADMARVCAERECTLVLMHSRGDVGDMASYKHADYSDDDVMTSIIDELAPAVGKAMHAGVKPERIILDPGLGFSKRGTQSIKALAHLPRLLDLGFEVMVGASRKRFIGELTGVEKPADRVAGTIGANVVALTLGATWFRVHDVRENRHALDAAAGILGARS